MSDFVQQKKAPRVSMRSILLQALGQGITDNTQLTQLVQAQLPAEGEKRIHASITTTKSFFSRYGAGKAKSKQFIYVFASIIEGTITFRHKLIEAQTLEKARGEGEKWAGVGITLRPPGTANDYVIEL